MTAPSSSRAKWPVSSRWNSRVLRLRGRDKPPPPERSCRSCPRRSGSAADTCGSMPATSSKAAGCFHSCRKARAGCPCCRAIHQRLIDARCPGRRVHVADALGVLPRGAFEREGASEGSRVLVGAVLPVRLQRHPEVVVQALVVGVAVLHRMAWTRSGCLTASR